MKKYLSFAMAITFAACNNIENPVLPIDDDSIIRLSSGVVASRSGDGVQGETSENIVADGLVYAWLYNNTVEPAFEVYKAWKLKADGEGGLIPEIEKAIPYGLTSLKSYALYANSIFEAETTTLPSEVTHSILSSQTLDTDYHKSDLLYSVTDEIKGGKNNVNIMTFYHMLSKVVVNVNLGEDFDGIQSDDVSVDLINILPKAKMSIDQSLDQETLSKQNVRNSLIDAEGDPVSVEMKVLEPNKSFSAIIVPQTITNDFLQIKVGEYKYFYKNDNPFESGKQYTFDLTVTKTGLELEVIISDWKQAELITGNAVSVDFTAVKNAMTEKDLLRGVIRGSDGSFKAYYIFDEQFQSITSYVINKEMQDDKQIDIKTQKIYISDENSVTWNDSFAGIKAIENRNGVLSLVGNGIDGFVIDDNKGAADDFNKNKAGHYIVTIDRTNKTFLNGAEMSKSFFDELLATAQGWKIELNGDQNDNLRLTIMDPFYTTFYSNPIIIDGKDFITFSWNGKSVNMSGVENPNLNYIPKIFSSYFDTNIIVRDKSMPKTSFYIINKAGKGWFKVVK